MAAPDGCGIRWNKFKASWGWRRCRSTHACQGHTPGVGGVPGQGRLGDGTGFLQAALVISCDALARDRRGLAPLQGLQGQVPVAEIAGVEQRPLHRVRRLHQDLLGGCLSRAGLSFLPGRDNNLAVPVGQLDLAFQHDDAGGAVGLHVGRQFRAPDGGSDRGGLKLEKELFFFVAQPDFPFHHLVKAAARLLGLGGRGDFTETQAGGGGDTL